MYLLCKAVVWTWTWTWTDDLKSLFNKKKSALAELTLWMGFYYNVVNDFEKAIAAFVAMPEARPIPQPK